jgi:Uma2 family endonuclease
MAEYTIKTRKWTRAEYDKLIALGFFEPGEHVELIGGELMVAEPQGAPHYTAIAKTARALEAAFGPSWTVRTQGPIGLDDESEPEPDVAVVPGELEDYRSEHPSRPVLTVEVAQSSLSIDRERKGSLYARAQLQEYWVLNLDECLLEVYREPVADSSAVFGWRFSRREDFSSSANVAPLWARNARVRIADLLP